jgi:hypothetical protein
MKKKKVQKTLPESIRRKKQLGWLSLEGKIHWEGNLNEMRRSRFP